MSRRRGRFNGIALGFVVLMVLMVALVASNGLRRTSHITLPSPTASSPSGSGEQISGEAVIRVEVTPDTVQAAVETLHRPERYARRITVERLWDGGSGAQNITVSVSGKWTRADETGADNRVRHAVTDGETTYIWYDDEKSFYSGAAGDISEDEEQGIPTYEDILKLDPSDIVQADYRTFSNEDCIFVETAADNLGYVQRYWVSVHNGLLSGAERLLDGEPVYRMAAQGVSEALPTAADFTLPNGTVLEGAD